MIKKLARKFSHQRILLVCFVMLTLSIFGFAQSKVDLEIKTQTASETARGGEPFSYTIIITNVGFAKATDVKLINEPENSLKLVANSTSKGNCRFEKADYKANLYCSLGDLEIGETVTIIVEVKINDFGGEPKIDLSQIPESPRMLETLEKLAETVNIQKKPNSSRTLIANIDVSAEESEENRENNHAEVFAELLPSKNKPPRLEIISPKRETTFIKPLNKQIEIPIIIKAFDLDGKIAKVTVGDSSRIQFIYEDNQQKYVIDGKKYTKQELQEIYENEELLKSLEVTANLTGKDTYTYIAKNFTYGTNTISIDAVDDGGRRTSETIEFVVKRDATIEIVSPKNNQIFTPDSTITVETNSKINDSTLNQLRIQVIPNNYFYPDPASLPLLQQTSKIGNAYKHQYIWKNVQEGVYHLDVMLFDGKIPTLYAKGVIVIVAEPRVIKIFSLKNGQEFEEGKPIKISVDATDAKGKIVEDELKLIVDGKTENTIYNSWTNGSVPPYEKVLDKNYGYNLTELEKGTHTIQVIAQYKNGDDIKLGESEVITIKVK